MKCIICNNGMEYFFSKDFNIYDLKTVDYHKCSECGFVASKTHYELTSEEWKKLNYVFHTDSNLREDNPYNRNQRYFNQALMISMMDKFGLFSGRNFLDWGSGIGSVSILSKKLFELDIHNYDKYIEPEINKINSKLLENKNFDLVINCAVFEHITHREMLNEIESMVSDVGCLAIHTLVPETVPRDPDWMYLLPVHCSFHTNKSMGILMNQWGYNCSVYNEQSKLWILFKKKSEVIKPNVNKLNKLLGWEYLKFKNGFVDYWK